MEKPDFKPEWYIHNNKLMANRYEKEFNEININWKKFYREMRESLSQNEYFIWIFLCGIPETIKSINIRKIKNKSNFIYEVSKKRILTIKGKDDLQLYLKNL
jgi:hypothetical protein